MFNYDFMQPSYPTNFYYQPIYVFNPTFQYFTHFRQQQNEKQNLCNHENSDQKYLERPLLASSMTNISSMKDSSNQKSSLIQTEKSQNVNSHRYLQQVKNRNILPNNLNVIFSFIRRANRSGNLVQKIISKLDKSNSFSATFFYSYQMYLKEKLPCQKKKNTLYKLTTYLEPSLTIFSVKQQLFYNKVCRILICQFLKSQHLLHLLTNDKIKKTNKRDHLKIKRYLLLKFGELFQQQMCQ